MGTDRQETIPLTPEEDSVCLICLRLYSDENNYTDSANLLYFQRVFDIVSKYLCADIFANCFKWDFVAEGISPVCKTCFVSMEKIFKIKQQLDKLQNAIEIVVKSFTCEVIDHHNKLELLYTKKNGIPPTSEIDIFKQLDQELYPKVRATNCRSNSLNEAGKNKDENEIIPSATAKNPEITKNSSSGSMSLLKASTKTSNSTIAAKLSDISDVTKYGNILLKPLRIVVTRSSTVGIPSILEISKTTAKIVPDVKPLRIDLTRLRFDTKGNVLSPMDTSRKQKHTINKTQADLKRIVIRGNRANKKVGKKASSKAKRNDRKADLTNGDISDGESNDENISGSDQKSHKLAITIYHNVSKRFQCQDTSCPLAFNFSKEVQAHSLKSGHINEKKYKCKDCEKSYFRNLDLKLHRKLHLLKKTWKYTLYSRKFNKNSSRINKPCFSSEKIYKCENCGKPYIKKINYENHLKLHSKKSFKCKTCIQKFQWRISFNGQRCKNSDDNYQCLFCSKSFLNRLSFNQQRLSHLKRKIGKQISCVACKKVHFNSRVWDKCIIRHFREGNTNSFICAICESVFKTSKKLDDHSVEKIHVNKKHFFCFVCRKPFYKHKELEDHLTTHKDGDSISHFRKISGRKCHINTKKFHNNVQKDASKDHYCSICEKKFKYKHNLDDHLNTHSGEKPHKCKICRKRFQQRNELFKHSKYCSKKSETEDSP